MVSKHHKGNTIFGDFFYDGTDGKGAWSSITHNLYSGFQKINVPAGPLDTVLKHHKIPKVDFFSLDVEGYELNVLKGIDWETTDVTYILVEVNFNDYALEDMEEYLGARGYKNIANMSNFTKETNEDWDGGHQDYLFGKI